jgi:hypothetical protein
VRGASLTSLFMLSRCTFHKKQRQEWDDPVVLELVTLQGAQQTVELVMFLCVVVDNVKLKIN